MKRLSSILVAGGIALAVAGASNPAWAGAAEDYIAQLDQALKTQPAGGAFTKYSPGATAEALRNQAAAAMNAGSETSAEKLALLALHQLGSNGIAGGDTVDTLGMVGGGWPSGQPAVAASDLAGGAPSPAHVATARQAVRVISE